MFRLLRKTLILLGVIVVSLVAYRYLGNPDDRRHLIQTAEELKEGLPQEKKSFPWTGTAVVVEVIKGDRLKVDLEVSRKLLVRLAAIDAPELARDHFYKGQPLAEESRDYLSRLLKGRAVDMAIVGTDSTKTPLVLITVEGEMINAKMVEAGLAEVTPETLENLPAKQRHALQNSELVAQRNRRGIWALTNYVRPVEFRIRNKGAL
jgi:micrococcal nuclease